MAWFHKTLKDMEKAIENNQWDEVEKILGQHNYHHRDKIKEEVEHDLSKTSFYISEYSEHLGQIFALLGPYFRGKPERIYEHDKMIMEIKVKKAIECAWRFEETIKHLIKEGKFME